MFGMHAASITRSDVECENIWGTSIAWKSTLSLQSVPLMLKLSSWRAFFSKHFKQTISFASLPPWTVHTESWQIFAHFYAAISSCIWWRMKNSFLIVSVDLIENVELQLCRFTPFKPRGQKINWTFREVEIVSVQVKKNCKKHISGFNVINSPFHRKNPLNTCEINFLFH